MIRPLTFTLPFTLSLLLACGGGQTADTTAADTSGDPAADDPPAIDVGASDPASDPAAGDTGGAAEQVAQGETVWGDACSVCHGDAGEGKGKKNPPVVGAGALTKYRTAADLYAYIKK
ncbi:MAG TPA: c-type cytochrome, partial [Kofleriaceae bacterium]|nr:c-type cytochrome [Kofleriaceae bacterium]